MFNEGFFHLSKKQSSGVDGEWWEVWRRHGIYNYSGNDFPYKRMGLADARKKFQRGSNILQVGCGRDVGIWGNWGWRLFFLKTGVIVLL